MTVMVKLQLAVLPDGSLAWKTWVVIPNGKMEPDSEPVTRLTTWAQLSDAVTVNVTLLVQTPGSVKTTMGEGHVILGASVSSTVSDRLQVVACRRPVVSAAVKETGYVPGDSTEPDTGPC